MRRPTVSAAIVVGAVLGLVAGCDDEPPTADRAGATTTAVAGPDATTSTQPSGTTGTTATTLPPLPTAPQPTGEDAVGMLLDAWRAGDRATARTVATAEAVDALFAIVAEAGQARGCNEPGANPNVSCVYRLSVGELQVRAVPSTSLPGWAGGDGYVVDFVILGT